VKIRDNVYNVYKVGVLVEMMCTKNDKREGGWSKNENRETISSHVFIRGGV